MSEPPHGLRGRQREVGTHRAGRLVVLGAAGTGKTYALGARHAWLATEGGLEPEHVLALTHSVPAVDGLRAQVEAGIGHGFAELHVHTVPGFCARLLRDEADEAGLDPLYVPHGIETSIFKPGNKAEAREKLGLSKYEFLAVMVAANKGQPSRKSFNEVFAAWTAFVKEHDNAPVSYTHLTLPTIHSV